MQRAPRSWWLRTSAAGLTTAAVVGFLAGRISMPNTVRAADKPPSDYDKRVVAYLHGGKLPITREDLGEYLIARLGAERIELLVNKTIIDQACREKGIEVTAAEVEAALLDDLKVINVNREQFVKNVLKEYRKTLYEWKEDVLRPRLQLQKLCQLSVKVGEDEIQKAFAIEFGPKVEGRLIIWPHNEKGAAFQEYNTLRTSEEAFEQRARTQSIASLAATGGRIKPFGKGAGTDPRLEDEAFKLKEKEITTLIETKEGIVCFKLEKQIPADATAKLEAHRERLHREVYLKKISAEIPKYFGQLQTAANPQIFIKRNETTGDLERTTQQLLQMGGTQPKNK